MTRLIDLDDIMIVVLTRNRSDLLAEVLGELSQWSGVGAVSIVNNASTDDTATMVASRFGNVEMVHSAVNLGATGGRNLGLSHAAQRGFNFVFLAEDDTFPSRQAFDSCRAAAGLHPDAVLVGSSGGTFRFGLTRWGRYRQSVGADCVVECDFVHFDNCLVDLVLLDEIGPLREDFFIMFEEPELGWRARRAGRRILAVPIDVDRSNAGAAASAAGFPWRSYYQTRNYLRFVIDARSPILWVGFVARHVHQVSRELRLRRTDALRLRARGARDAVSGRMGLRVPPPDERPPGPAPSTARTTHTDRA